MTTNQIYDSFLLLIRGNPYIRWAKVAFFIQPTHGPTHKEAEIAVLNRLVQEKVITNYEYIEDSETPVVVVETRSAGSVVRTSKCVNQGRRSFSSGTTRPRASVFCMEQA